MSTLFTFLFLGSDPASDSQGLLGKCCQESEEVNDGRERGSMIPHVTDGENEAERL